MFTPFERTVAIRYLLARRQERSISIIALFALCGIALGVATLIIVMAVRTGYRDDFIDKILGFDGHIYVLGKTNSLKEYDTIVKEIQKIPGVTNATAVVEEQAFAQTKTRGNGMIVRGITHEDLKARTLISDNIIEGNLDSFGVSGNTIVGRRFAEKNDLGVGDTITLLSPSGRTTAFGTAPRQRTFTIEGVFDAGMSKFEETILFISREDAQKFFLLDKNISNIEILTENPEEVDAIRPQIEKILGPNSFVRDWKQRNARFMAALNVESNVMFVIVTLVIMIASFNIVTSMIMLVKDKRRDIAVLRSMGATRSMILRLFFITGSMIGIVGTIAGVIIGVTFSLNVEHIRQFLQSMSGKTIFDSEIYYLTRLPAKLELSVVLLTSFIALFLTFLATIYPAWRATKFDPAEALRND